jgi:ubiquinone/menaquinone biosynthesis C-methylase UbiE
LFFSQDKYLRPVKTILRFFFKLLYHQLAFAYDFVAATVSVGQWQNWIASILPLIKGTRILEIGHGPGHLQRILLSRGLVTVAIDESAPMGLLAKHNTNGKATLARALAQGLPFTDSSFDTVIATFPADYIKDPLTLSEVKRCLSDGGRFIVLPVALQMGRKPLDRIMSLLFRITHQSPVDPLEEVQESLSAPFIEAGFETEVRELKVKSSLLLVIVAIKNSP